MTEFRKELVNKIIAIYGFEHEITINITNLCERWANDRMHDRTLKVLVESHEMFPDLDDD